LLPLTQNHPMTQRPFRVVMPHPRLCRMTRRVSSHAYLFDFTYAA
jgi:hypothetical protein